MADRRIKRVGATVNKTHKWHHRSSTYPGEDV